MLRIESILIVMLWFFAKQRHTFDRKISRRRNRTQHNNRWYIIIKQLNFVLAWILHSKTRFLFFLFCIFPVFFPYFEKNFGCVPFVCEIRVCNIAQNTMRAIVNHFLLHVISYLSTLRVPYAQVAVCD